MISARYKVAELRRAYDFKAQFEQIKDTLPKVIEEMFPIEGNKRVLKINRVWVEDNKDWGDYYGQKKTKMSDRTWAVPVYASVSLLNKNTGTVEDSVSKVKLMNLPKPTIFGSYIIKGNEYQIDNQLRWRPGSYVIRNDKGDLKAQVNLSKGIEISKSSFRLNPERGKFDWQIGQAHIDVYPFLRALDVSDDDIKKYWGSKLVEESSKNYTEAKGLNALKSFNSKVNRNLKKETLPEQKEAALNYLLEKTEVSPETTKMTLGKEYHKVTTDFILDTTKKLRDVYSNKTKPDDRDDFAYKDIVSLEDFLTERLRKKFTPIQFKLKRSIDGDKTRGIKDILSGQTVGTFIEKFFTSSDLSNTPEQTNPLHMISGSDKVTITGEGGVTQSHAIQNTMRNLHPSHLGYMDPAHTPDSQSVGVNMHLPLGAMKQGSKLITHYYDVNQKDIVALSPQDLKDKHVAFPDQAKIVGDNIEFKNKIVRARYNNEVVEVPQKEIDYLLPDERTNFSLATNMVPFLNATSGNRVQFSAQHQGQALSLKHREKPKVQVESLTPGRTFEQYVGEAFSKKSPVSGIVQSVTDNAITIKGFDGSKEVISVYKDFPLNQISGKSFLNAEVKVKPGDEVKKNDLLFDSNFTKDGVYSPGVNLKTAYMPYYGYNFEDGIVISESGSEKLTSQHMFVKTFSINKYMTMDLDKYQIVFPGDLSNEQAAKLGPDGIVKKGSVLEYDDPWIVSYQQNNKNPELMELAKIHKKLSLAPLPMTERWKKQVKGRVVDVAKTSTSVKVYIKTEEPAQIGDKLAGRYGNKGVITKIIPDKEAPRMKNGDPVDIILNPHGVPSRKNPGQLLETAITKTVTEDKPFIVKNFSDRSYAEMIDTELKKKGVSPTEVLFNPKTGKDFENEIGVGEQYFLKLAKQAETQYSKRYRGSYDLNERPTKGGESGAKSLDLLTFYSMLSHGSKANLREMATWKANKNDELWRALRTGQALPTPEPTFAWKKFEAMLKGAGVNIKRDGASMHLVPLTDREVKNISDGEIKDAVSVRAKDLLEEKNGLFDPEVTGGTQGKSWSHVKLAEPFVNPIFEEPVKKILGMNKKQFMDIVSGKLFYDKKEGLNTEGKGVTAGNAFKEMLGGIDIDSILSDTKERAKSATGTTLNDLNKKIRYIENLKKNELTPQDAYLTKRIPVIPPIYRPIYPLPSGDLNIAPPNFLYKDMILVNNQLKNSMEFPDAFSTKQNLRKGLYDSLSAVIGIGDPISERRQKEKPVGFIGEIGGKDKKQGIKEGFFQSKLLSRKQELSGRAVIMPEPKLSVDQIGLPEDMAWELYKPFVTKELVLQGYTPLDAENKILNKEPVAKLILEQCLKERPVLFNRAPSLHKFSILGFEPVLTKGRAIKIPPLVVSGFNADFDGDAMTVFVPIGDEAVEEAKRMKPSRHLYKPGTGTLILLPSQEAIIGIYRLSSSPEGRKQINDLLPEGISVTKQITKKELYTLLNGVREKFPSKYSEVLDKIKQLGDKHATESGFTISSKDTFDLDVTKMSKKLILDTEKMLPGLSEDQKTKKILELASKIENELKTTGSGSNALIEMSRSGAKGSVNDAQQLLASPVIFSDFANKPVNFPIKNSISEGLSFSDYWTSLYGARRGSIDRSKETSIPGEFNKVLLANTVKTVVTSQDCGTSDGREFSVKDSFNTNGRYLAKDYPGVVKKNELVNSKLLKAFLDANILRIKVRTPLTCESTDGVCALCYGTNEDTGETIDLGTNIGAISGQAMGEPLTQMMMRTFHSGGVFNKKHLTGYPVIDRVMRMATVKEGKAAIATEDDEVVSVGKSAIGANQITTRKNSYTIDPDLNVKVKKGDLIKKGQVLSEGYVDPNEIKDTIGMESAQKFMVDTLYKAYDEQGLKMNKRVFETVVRSVTNTAQVLDPGDSDFISGDIAPYTSIKAFNKDLFKEVMPIEAIGYKLAKDYGSYKKGQVVDANMANSLSKYKTVMIEKKPVVYDPVLKGMDYLPIHQKDWMATLGRRESKTAIQRGVTEGWKSDIHGYSPVPAFAYGAEFGLDEDDKKY